MRILIGNDADRSIRERKDTRSSAQRIIWFAGSQDVVVLPAQPDPDYVRHVTALTGADANTIRFYVPPGGSLDSSSLTDKNFLRDVNDGLGNCTEVFALWPSPHVAAFSKALGLRENLAGAAFIEQAGGALANSKAYFRAFAGGAGVPIPAGTVCHSVSEAREAMVSLLSNSDAVVVKQAHNGSGNGNQLVLRSEVEVGQAGARHLYALDHGPDAVDKYWAEQWSWASVNGRFPVVLEEFVPEAKSVYSEYHVDDGGVTATGSGILSYENRQLAAQIVPLQPENLGAKSFRTLIDEGRKLAEVYRSIGYRGYLSADALVDPSGKVTFTEANSQVSGSLHLYSVIADKIIRTVDSPRRYVAEYDIPDSWNVGCVDQFLKAMEESGDLYDSDSRLGVMLSVPFLPTGQGKGGMLCITYDSEQNRDAMYHRVQSQFSSVQ